MYLSAFGTFLLILIAPAFVAAIPLSIIAIVRATKVQAELNKMKKENKE